MAISENINFNENEQYSIPMEITAETIRDFGIKRADSVPAKIGNKIVSVIMVPCTKEQYYAYMRPIWAEMQREERSRRCMVSNGRGGLKRCDGDCSKCTRMKTGSALSLNYLKDENGLEASEPVVDACGTVLTAVLFQDLMDKLRELDPELAKIFELLYDGKSQRSIAKIIGAKSQSSVESKVGRMRRILQQYVAREDILG